MRTYLSMKRHRGSALIAVMAALLAAGVALTIASTTWSMVSSSAQTSLRNTTGQILTQSAYMLVAEANKSGSYPVATAPAVWSGSNPTVAPTQGTANAVGLITATSAAPKTDAWGSNLAYCTYTAAGQADPVFAVISAGPDKVFQTTCTQALAGTAAGDDGVRVKSVANVLQGVGGTIYYGDPVANVAALNALPTVHVGETRVTLDTGYTYVNKTGTPTTGWVVSGGGSTGQGAPTSCPAGYVLIAAFTLPDNEYVPSFCAMQYGARILANGVVTADVTAFGTAGPAVNVTWRQAKALCSAADANLITESQWLSIAHQAVSVASNWSGGSVGSGTLARGWSAYTAYGDAWSNTAVAPQNTAACLYNTGADTCGASGSVLYRRTYNLPNGSVIWDISGNVWEWTDATIPVANRYNGGTSQWMAYNTTSGDLSPAITTNVPLNKRPPNNYNAVQGMGRYYDGYTTTGAYANYADSPNDCTSGNPGYCDPYAAFVRGGGWDDGAYSGPFALHLNLGRSVVDAGIGFRCTR